MAKKKEKKKTKKTTKQVTSFPKGTYTIKFANGETEDITKYNPDTRCKAIRDVNGKRDFSQRKGSKSKDPDDPGNGEYYGEVDISGIKDSNAREIAKCLLKKKINNDGDHLNGAQVVGILANIKRESGFKPSSVGDNGTSFGICQWHNGRGTKMKKTAGSNWASNIEGQVDYLWKELTGSYKSSVLNPIL